MKRRKPRILLFVEDPGAANYIQYLPGKMKQNGTQCSILAAASARKFLDDRKIAYEPLDKTPLAYSILERFRPDLLILGTSSNPDSFAFRMLTSARAMNIKSVGIVDNLSNASLRFRGLSKAPLKYAPDWLVVPDQPTMLAFKALGFPATHIRICGHPQYDYVVRASEKWTSSDRDDFRKRIFPGNLENRNIFLFACVPFEGIKSNLVNTSFDFTLKGRGTSQFEPEVVIEEFLDAVTTLKLKPFLVLRLHPKQKPDDLSNYLAEFDFISSGGSPIELLYASDLIVGLPTMLLVEAVLLGRRTLAIGAKFGRVPVLPTIRMGLTPYVSTREHLRAFFSKQLNSSPQPTMTEFSERFVFGADRMLVDFLKDILLEQRKEYRK